ncbi:MAG: alpha-D-ribose 1-methylphosphonate 5-triphosphate diphosphatase, partial [Pseudomonadota bacterium]
LKDIVADKSFGEDMEGDFILPGLIDIHTDNLERHFFPRPNVDWDPISAAIIHDGNCTSVGITTVFDSLSIGSWSGKEARRLENLSRLVTGLDEADIQGLLSANHFLHWRCETTNPFLPELFEPLSAHRLTRLLSVMDHTPGQRQYPDLERHLNNWRTHAGLSEEEVKTRYHEMIENQANYGPKNRHFIAEYAKTHDLALASHDDQLIDHIDDARAIGATISEFPTTMDATKAAHQGGMVVAMGAPNLMRGGSYSGNVSAGDVASENILDVFASDYVPRSMIEAAFRLTQSPYDWSLPKAMGTVTWNAAHCVGLRDRGVLREGLRADFIRVRLFQNRPVVRSVWVGGVRAA